MTDFVGKDGKIGMGPPSVAVAPVEAGPADGRIEIDVYHNAKNRVRITGKVYARHIQKVMADLVRAYRTRQRELRGEIDKRKEEVGDVSE